MTGSPSDVYDNVAERRFELEEGGLVAFADYQRLGDILVIPHVEAPMALRGTGAAARLMSGLLSLVREQGLRVRPLCPYAAAFMRRGDYDDLVA